MAVTLADRSRLALRALVANVLRGTDGRDVLLNSPDGWEVDQPWLWWTGGGPIGHPIPGAGDPTGFSSIPAVSHATNLIVDTIAALPRHVYRDDTERLPTPTWIADPQALRLDGRVIDQGIGLDATRMSDVDFWGQWFLAALWYGDGFVYVPQRDAAGAPKPPLWQFHPDAVEIRDGAYWVSDVELEAGSIIHLHGHFPIVEGRGTGVLAHFANALSNVAAVGDYVSGAFGAGVPAGYLKANVPNLNQDQADALKTRWMQQHGNTRQRTIAVLNATTDFVPLTWSPIDMAAADFSRLSVQQVALMFDMPAYMLGAAGDTSTYANVESRMTEFYELCLLPWLRRGESVLSAQLPLGTGVRFEVEGLLRADTKTRYDTYAIAIDKGILTPDEVRALENRPPMSEAVSGGVL